MNFIERQTDWYNKKTKEITFVRKSIAIEGGRRWMEFDLKIIDNFTKAITEIYKRARRAELLFLMRAFYP